MKRTKAIRDAEAKSCIAEELVVGCWFAVNKGELAGATEEERAALRSVLDEFGYSKECSTAKEQCLSLTQVRKRFDRAVQLLHSSVKLYDHHLLGGVHYRVLVEKGIALDKLRRLGDDVELDQIARTFEEAFQLAMHDSDSLTETIREWNAILHLAIDWSIRGKTAAAASLMSAAYVLTGLDHYRWVLSDILDDNIEDFRLLLSHLEQLRKCAGGTKAGSPDNAAINGNEP